MGIKYQHNSAPGHIHDGVEKEQNKLRNYVRRSTH